MRRYRSLTAVLLAIAMSALVGGFLGKSALATDDKVPEHYKAFTAALSAIEANYVDKVESDRLVYSAIRGMLGTLDPHSSFFDPREYAQMRERQEGRYYGLGITITSVDGEITAVLVFEGSPAYKNGVRRGDVIAKIGGQDAKGLTTLEAQNKLRGPKGHDRAHRHQAPRLRAADSARRDARRGVHPDRPGVLHDRRDDRATSSCGISARTPTAT